MPRIKLIKEIRKNPIFGIFFKMLIMALIVPTIIINVLAFSYFSSIVVNHGISTHTGLFSQFSAEFEQKHLNSQLMYNVITTNTDVSYLLNINPLEDGNTLEASRSAERLSDVLKNLLLTCNAKSVYIYSQKTNYVYSNTGSAHISNFEDKSWYTMYKKSSMQNFVMTRKLPNDDNILTFCYNFNDTNKTSAIIVINTDISAFRNTIKDTFFGIASEDGEIVLCTDISYLNKNINEFNVYSKFRDNIDTELATKKDGNTILSVAKSPISDHIYFLKTENLYASSENGRFIIVLVAVMIFASIFLAFFIAFFFSFKFYKSVAEIISYMDNPGSDKKLRKTKSNEMFHVIANVIHNSQNNEDINQELSNQLTVLKQAKISALQSQITPHFLFNTLQAINAVVISILKCNNNATRMIILFSKILETALDSENHLIPLSQELEYASDYLKLLNYRYNDKFIVEWDIPEELKSHTFLKLGIQPILENAAIYNGVADPDKVTIRVSAKICENALAVSVSNTGVPISEEKLEELNNLFENTESMKTKKHIGLANTNQRLKIIFGEKFGCHIEVIENKTTVTMKMPVIET